jgi:N utilization substance protein A
LSRSAPSFLIKLFEQEVPEIAEGIVKIICAAREPGQRAKLGVRSSDADVDPVGACVGMKGSRVQAVVQELRGEKIDIIPWNDDPARFVCNALAPAEISKVIIDSEVGAMEVIVADDQLSLAIGKRGQNVRLAARLTGWKIDVRSESKDEKVTGESFERLLAIDGMDEETASILFDNGYRSPEDIARATLAELTSFMGITNEKGLALQHGALRYLANPVSEDEDIEDEAIEEEEFEDSSELSETVEDLSEESEESNEGLWDAGVSALTIKRSDDDEADGA